MIKKIFSAVALTALTIVAKAQNSELVTNYIKTYCGIAVAEMQRTGVPAAIKLAQGILETTAGQSPLVIKSNNHFGIKCKQGYTGPYVLHDDDRPQERFMKYENSDQSYRDHSDFLKGRSRYASLFDLDPLDYASWARGLKKAGYATNPKYPQLLINLIEKYNLSQYTLMGLGRLALSDDVKNYVAGNVSQNIAANTEMPLPAKAIYPETDFLINNTKVVYVKTGTALSDVARTYKIAVNRLYEINDFGARPEILSKNTLVFLQLKRTMSDKLYHEVQAGETMYDIAQTEGIRLEALLEYNNMGKFDTPATGTKLKLRTNERVTAALQTNSSSNL